MFASAGAVVMYLYRHWLWSNELLIAMWLEWIDWRLQWVPTTLPARMDESESGPVHSTNSASI